MKLSLPIRVAIVLLIIETIFQRATTASGHEQACEHRAGHGGAGGQALRGRRRSEEERDGF